MDVMNRQQAAREAERTQANRAELAERIALAVTADGGIEPLPGLHLHRLSAPTQLHSVSSPAFCVIAQGSKVVSLADERYQYDPAHYLLYTAELPIISQVTDASKPRPYLSLRLDLDPALVGAVMVEASQAPPRRLADVRAIAVSPLDARLLDAVVRLVRLLDAPADAHFLAPMITREIVYRLLVGEQASRLRHIANLGGHTHRIVRAIDRLRREFDQPLGIEEIASELGMSISSFHHHFKAVTAMSPLQFQKQLRLQEARRLMLGEDLDATTVAYRVGYSDASHFSREYKGFFGLPPVRDMQRLRAVTAESNGH